MKYFISINQQVLSETKLDIIDGAILDYIYFYCNSQNKKVKQQRIIDKNNEVWTWIDYQSLLSDMPMLKFKSLGIITLRINKIKKSGYIKTKRFKHQKKYFQMTAKSDELFIQMNRAIQSREQIAIQSREPIKNKDIYKEKIYKDSPAPAGEIKKNDLINFLDKPSIGKPVKKNSSSEYTKEENKQINEIIDIFKQINPFVPFNRKPQRNAAFDIIKLLGFEQAVKITNYAISIQGKKFTPTITTPYKLREKFGDLKVYFDGNEKEEKNYKGYGDILRKFKEGQKFN